MVEDRNAPFRWSVSDDGGVVTRWRRGWLRKWRADLSIEPSDVASIHVDVVDALVFDDVRLRFALAGSEACASEDDPGFEALICWMSAHFTLSPPDWREIVEQHIRATPLNPMSLYLWTRSGLG